MDVRSEQGVPSTSRTVETLNALRDQLIAEANDHLGVGRVAQAADALKGLERATIDERTLELTDPLLPQLQRGRELVASFDPARRPEESEIVIIYGNYPHVFDNVVVNNPIKRHVADFWTFDHDRVEYDSRWERVERIFIINSSRRPDRLDGVLRELARVRAPLHRVVRVEAVSSDPGAVPAGAPADAAGQLACLSSHAEVVRRAQAQRHNNVLVLEDDFCFTSDTERHLDDVHAFLDRAYDYAVCLAATSKYGEVTPADDLLSRSFQPCTNTAGYFASRSGIEELVRVFDDAARRLRETGDTRSYAVDRCWSVLQESGRFYVFRHKLGFQSASFSDIEGSISRYLD